MWKVKTNQFTKEEIVHHGNQFLTGNGFMGYRGTLDEFDKNQLVGLNIPGVYDQFENKWREPVNLPNPFYTTLFYQNEELSVLTKKPIHHEVMLDISCGVYQRITTWEIDNKQIEIQSSRFISLANIHLMVMKYTVKATSNCSITVKTGIDGDVWDLNGPHLQEYLIDIKNNNINFSTKTKECQIPVLVQEIFMIDHKVEINNLKNYQQAFRQFTLTLKKDEAITFYKWAYINHHEDGIEKGVETLQNAAQLGYDYLYEENKKEWQKRWNISDVIIKGDEAAQFALRYSIYHLIILSQRHSDKVSIPARGISGQTYKGAIFWDTEMFMLPFYLATDLKTAKNLVKYRIHTLDGARIKAKEYGYRGAFYAWESQETGIDACSHYNVTDVFTNRPMRTYFRDKQIHISADIVYGIWETYLRTKDISILLSGGAIVILECARFYLSYGNQKLDKDQFEFIDVTGPDEYHERVYNNAFTNRMILETFKIALKVIDLLKENYPLEIEKIMKQLVFVEDYELLKQLISYLYLQKPNENNLIEQFDGYFKLEDTTVEVLRSRLLHPNEYWGGANGIATPTQIIKQADVITMLYLFKDDYTPDVLKANWEYYEKRTEHGSSLSACMYALVSCLNHNPEWAYPYFMKTATVDLTGDSKQYAGGIYIGGTHPAANGGAYMTAIYGFAGLTIEDNEIKLNPQLPKHWQEMEFKIILNNELMKICLTSDKIEITKE